MDADELRRLRDPTLARRPGAELDRYADHAERRVDAGVVADPDDRPEPSLDDHPLKRCIRNAWVLAPGLHHRSVAELVDCSTEYARRETKRLSEGEVPHEEVEAAVDVDLQRRLLARAGRRGLLDEAAFSVKSSVDVLDHDLPDRETIAAPEPPSYGVPLKEVIANVLAVAPELHYSDVATVAGCSDEYARRIVHDVREEAIPQPRVEAMYDDRVRSLVEGYLAETDLRSDDATATPAAVADADGDATDPDDLPSSEARSIVAAEPVKKTRLVNAYLSGADLSYLDAAELVDTSDEHARRTWRDVESGEIDDEELDARRDPRLVAAIERLAAEGGADAGPSADAEASPSGRYVPVEAVARVATVFDSLRRYSEADDGTDPRRTFIAREGARRLDELLEEAVVELDDG